MIQEFDHMTRDEFIQYICLVINYFYNTYDCFTKNEFEYIEKFISILSEVYDL